jgi:hypothetical protein
MRQQQQQQQLKPIKAKFNEWTNEWCNLKLILKDK